MQRTAFHLLPLLFLLASSARGEIVLENARLRAVLGEDACWKSLVDKQSGKERLARTPVIRFASATIGGKPASAESARCSGNRLMIGLAGGQTKLTFSVRTTADWIAFALESITGPRPSDLTLIRTGVNLTAHVGTRLNAGWCEDFAVCLMATGLQSQGRATRRGESVELAITTQDAPGPRLEGAGAALLGAPPAELPQLLWRLAEAYDLPRNGSNGLPSHQLPMARQSYWFLDVTEANVDEVVTVCERSGIRQVLISSPSWCRDVGHYTFRTNRYPRGLEGLKQVVAQLHRHGILAGMHCFASKVSKTDAYVSPLPDGRFWVEMSAPLAADIGPESTEIRLAADLSQWPGSPAAKRKSWEGGAGRHREVILDHEIVRYAGIGPEGKWDTLLGCQRGAWKTAAAAHRTGTRTRRYGVDGCIDGYIIDQETTLLAEVAARLAEVFNSCDFDAVYFDGGEDVNPARFLYYVSNFQAVAMAQFKKRPLLHMGTIFPHNLWHSFTRSGTVDTYLNTIHGQRIAGTPVENWPTVREHINRSVAYLLSIREDLIPGELGWFGIWPQGDRTDGLQLDEMEYLMAKSLAYDAPISLQTSLSQMEQHPLTPGVLEIVSAYEKLRLSGAVPQESRQRLQELNQDFLLVPGRLPSFVAVHPLSSVAGRRDVRACAGPWKNGSVASLWHFLGKAGTLTVCGEDLSAIDLAGNPVKLNLSPGKTDIPINHRRLLLSSPGLSPEALAALLSKATFTARPPATLWVEAESCVRIEGAMAKGSSAKVRDLEARGDFVVGTGMPRPSTEPDGTCEYRVTIPHESWWTLWARVRYPRGGDMSFRVDLPDGKGQWKPHVLGNCGRAGTAWHWTGSGGGMDTLPPGSPIQVKLQAGECVFRLHPREGHGRAADNPRLDVFCLTEDPSYVPADEDRKPTPSGN